MQHPSNNVDDRLLFDELVASELIGKYVLVGVTVKDKRGEFRRQEQFHGTVVEAHPGRGIKLNLRGARNGEEKWLPPATNVFTAASPGVYRLRASGEEVVNPDFTATWRLTQPDA